MQGRCMKCKEQRDMKNPVISMTARGGFMAKGSCSVCGTNMAKILSKVDAEKAIESGEAKKAY